MLALTRTGMRASPPLFFSQISSAGTPWSFQEARIGTSAPPSLVLGTPLTTTSEVSPGHSRTWRSKYCLLR